MHLVKSILIYLAFLFISIRAQCDEDMENLKYGLEILKIQRCSVGMRSGAIRNHQITASSEWPNDRSAHAASQGRLDNQGTIYSTGSWSAANKRSGEWLQVDLGIRRQVTAVVTQGRPGSRYVQWVASYKIFYGDSSSTLVSIKENGSDKIFEGNSDHNGYKVNYFPQPVTARYFRLVVLSWQEHPSLRMDFLTC